MGHALDQVHQNPCGSVRGPSEMEQAKGDGGARYRDAQPGANGEQQGIPFSVPQQRGP